LKEILKDGEKSISSISRELEKKGERLHRLTLSGYLRALKDLGILEERDVAPLKLFSLSPVVDSDVYSILRRELEKVDKSQRDAVGVYVLSKILNRAVTERELEKTMIKSAATGISPISKEERENYKKMGVPLEEGERMYRFSGDEREIFESAVSVLSSMVRDLMGLRGMYPKFKQKKLL
jgi:hypothetical protein